MSTKPQQPANTLDAAVKALRLYLMEKGVVVQIWML